MALWHDTVTESHDVLVLGTGAAASSAAYRCSQAGRDVAVVDSRPYGGTCSLRGCDPKKVLVGTAQLAEHAQRMQAHGLSADGIGIDWSQLMRFKRSFTRPVPKDREEAFQEAGMATLHGRARFVDETLLDVEGQRVEAEDIVVATGAKPRPLGIPGSEHLVTSDVFLDLDELPERIAFVGGGYISFEFAHLAARAGAQATILSRSERVLKAFDADLVDALVDASREAGIELHTEAPVREIEATEDGYRVYSDGEQPAQEHDLVVHGAGRVPEIEDLDLDEAGIEHDDHGVAVDEHLRSVSNEHVYAAGDAADTDGWPLTPIAGREGQLAARNLVEDEQHTLDYTGTASVVFTIPPLARVGMSEDEARQVDTDIDVREGEMSEWFSYARQRASPARYKVILEEGTGRVLGAHLLGVHAEETINLFVLAVRNELASDEVKAAAFAYPSHGSEIQYMV